MYILLNQDNIVAEIIPDENPIFPGVPIEDRYEKSFVDKLLYVDDSVEVAQNWTYDAASGLFFEPQPEPEEVEGIDETGETPSGEA